MTVETLEEGYNINDNSSRTGYSIPTTILLLLISGIVEIARSFSVATIFVSKEIFPFSTASNTR